MSKYTYTTLGDLRESPQVNVFGIIDGVTGPAVNGSGQWELVVELRDESLEAHQLPIRCKIFASSRGALDGAEMGRGDVFRVHRAKCRKDYNVSSELILQAPIGLGGCHFVAWEALVGGNMDPKGMSSVKCTITDFDKQKVASLREWWSVRVGGEGVEVGGGFLLPGHILSTPLARFPKHAYRDIIVRVRGIVQSRDSPHLWAVRAWDGTKPSMPFVKIMDPDPSSSRWEDSESEDSHNDYTVDIYVFDEFVQPAIDLEPGDVAVFRNVHSAYLTREDSWSLTMHTNRTGKYHRSISKIDPLDSLLAEKFCKELDSRISSIQRSQNRKTSGAIHDSSTRKQGSETSPIPSTSQSGGSDLTLQKEGLTGESERSSSESKTKLPPTPVQQPRFVSESAIRLVSTEHGTGNEKRDRETSDPVKHDNSENVISSSLSERRLPSSENSLSTNSDNKRPRCSTPEFDKRLNDLEREFSLENGTR